MFRNTKIKLTTWYLLIIMTISIGFSAVMYGGVNLITQKAIDNQRARLERRLMDFEGLPMPVRDFSMRDELVIGEIRERTLSILLTINICILIISGGLGYLLAEKTLEPIEEMVKKQKRFISDAAHELKTPLAAMKTDMEVTLRDKNANKDDYATSLKDSIDEIDKLNLFIGNLLKKSKYQIEQRQIEKTDVDFAVIIQEALNMLGPVAKKKHINIERNLNKAIIKANKDEIYELVMNLTDNAIKYSKENESIQVSLNTEDKNAVFTVIDHGVGISQEEIANIFEPFYKVDKSRSKNTYDGFGLGLSIVKEIVKEYNGHIVVSSVVNEGTTFKVTFPISNQ